jgi:hypothetical protein
VAKVRVQSAKCPTCGAGLQIPPHVVDIPCRYCGNVIHIEHRKPPPNVHPFGTPGGVPSRTLYVDPAAMHAAGRGVGIFIAMTTLVPVLIAVAAGVGPWALRSFKSSVRPFPATCGLNETLNLSGDYESEGPLVEVTGPNCKLRIKGSKLKGATLVKGDAVNLEITLEDVTLETTEVAIRTGSNTKLRVKGGKLSSPENVIEGESNMRIEVEDATIESTEEAAILGKYNLKLEATNAKILGKTAAIEADSNADIVLRGTSEVTSAGTAIKATSNMKLDAQGGTVDGGETAIFGASGMKLKTRGTVIRAKERAIVHGSSGSLSLNEGSVTSETDAAISTDSTADYELAGTTVQGASAAIRGRMNMKLLATKKAKIVASSGNGVEAGTNLHLTLVDASIEASRTAVKGEVNTKVRLSQGAKISGKQGGLLAGNNLEIDGKGGIIEGGTGPAIEGGFNARVSFTSGALRGTPAITLTRKPSLLDLAGAKVEGGQRIPAR